MMLPALHRAVVVWRRLWAMPDQLDRLERLGAANLHQGRQLMTTQNDVLAEVAAVGGTVDALDTKITALAGIIGGLDTDIKNLISIATGSRDLTVVQAALADLRAKSEAAVAHAQALLDTATATAAADDAATAAASTPAAPAPVDTPAPVETPAPTDAPQADAPIDPSTTPQA
jgi:hypothetical protein